MTIGYLSKFNYQSGCRPTLPTHEGYVGCCGSVDGSGYTLTIEDNIPLRQTDPTNPLYDVDGFVISAQMPDQGCCTNNDDKWCYKKSDLSFERTVLSSVTLSSSGSSDSTPCAPKFDIALTVDYVREVYVCGENGEPTLDSSATTNARYVNNNYSGATLTKVYSAPTSAEKFTVSFEEVDARVTIEKCGVSKSGSTTLSAEGYTISVVKEQPIRVDCSGGTAVFGEINGGCDSDIENIIVSTTGTTYNVSRSGRTISVEFGHSENNQTTDVSITLSIGDKSITISQTYPRTTCGIEPVVTTNNSCGPFFSDIDWSDVENASYHPYD